MRLTCGSHLTFCSNIFPGQTWQEHFAQLKQHVPSVKQIASPIAPMGLGLRLSSQACDQLNQVEAMAEFQHWLQQHNLYVFTLNGFPYGQFHQTQVKEQVYRPDWSDSRRLEYSRSLARVLCQLLPTGQAGSISTVPGCIKADAEQPDYLQQIQHHLLLCVADLHQIYLETGKIIALALEPEPGCLLETTQDTLDFFERWIFSTGALRAFASYSGMMCSDAEQVLRQHLGVCLDTCHAAVMFESPLEAVLRFKQAQIPVIKLQLTAALQIDAIDETTLAQLEQFVDPVYLHQTSIRQQQQQNFFLDLDAACNHYDPSLQGSQWRSHFHVPVYFQQQHGLSSTSAQLSELLIHHARSPICRHLEIETYTFDVLPQVMRNVPVSQAIVNELQWVQQHLREQRSKTRIKDDCR